MSRLGLFCVSFVFAAAGCSAIPPGGDPALDPALSGCPSGAPLGKLVVAPISTLSLSTVEVAKGWKASETGALDRESIRSDLIRALQASRRWDAVSAGSAQAISGAWFERDDWVLEVELGNLETHFDGRNGWWIPNIVNFFLNTPFAWFVATEDYSLSFEVILTLASGDCGRVVASQRFPVRVSGSFDEFDRGWQLLGPITSSLDSDGWRGIAEKLLPAARLKLAVQVALESAGRLSTALASPVLRDGLRKTLVLAVGVTDYEDPRALPPLAHAREDARRVASEFLELGALPEHVVTLTDAAATVAAVTSAVTEHLGRARDGDTVVLTVSGYGTRDTNGRPAILLYDSTPATRLLDLEELRRMLAQLRGEKILVVDAGFDGRGRSAAVGPRRSSSDPGLGASPVSTLLAGRSSDAALAPDHLGSGLLTYHFVRRLADLGRDGRSLGVEALFANVQASVAEDAELLGERQVPVLLGSGKVVFETRRAVR
jgi:hypothetical protein